MVAMLYALLATLVVVGVPTAAVLYHSTCRERTLVLGAVTGVVLFLVNSFWFYASQPTFGLSLDAFYSGFWSWWVELLVVTVVLVFDSIAGRNSDQEVWSAADGPQWPTTAVWFLSYSVIAALLFGIVVGGGGVFTQSRANILKDVLKVHVHEDTRDLPNTDEKRIAAVAPQVVNFKIKSALRGDAATRYSVHGDSSPVMVDKRMFWLNSLVPDGLFDFHNVDGKARGYIATDAGDINANSQYKWDQALGTDANPNLMDLHLNGWFQHDVERVLWNRYGEKIVSNVHMEVDDNWKPWYVATLNERPLGFNMGHTFPHTVVVIDPVTGEDTVYNLADAPSWIDQVWGSDEVKAALNAWGRWGQSYHGFWYEGKTNRYQVSGEPQVIVTDTGMAWQVLMTSYQKDTVASYYVLVNTRTGETHAYKVPELVLGEKVIETVRESAKNVVHLEPAFAAMYKISGRLTWFSPLLKSGAGTGSADESNANGVALVPADNVNGTTVILKESGSVLADAFRDYEQLVSTTPSTAGPQSDVTPRTITGTVDTVSPALLQGNVSAIYFTLAERPTVEFRVEITLHPEVKYVRKGSKVTITYRDSGQSPFTLSNYDDQGMTLVK